MINDLTTYQIYLILLGYLAERHDDTQMLRSVLTELYKRTDKSEYAELQGSRNGDKSKTLDTLIVTFDHSVNDKAAICISRVLRVRYRNESTSLERVVVLKGELGEQAELLYRALIEQDFKIKSEEGTDE